MVFPEFIREYHFHNRFKKLFLLKFGLKLGELKSRGEPSCRGGEAPLPGGDLQTGRCNLTEVHF